MSRIPPAPRELYEPLFGATAPLRQQVYAQAPAIAGPYLQFMKALRENGTLPRRLVELVRLRVSLHNQCRTCMSIRYADGLEAGIDEGLVCSLERPEEAAQLFQSLLDRGKREPTGPDLGYEQRLFTSWPAAGLATCLFQQGRYAESRDWFGRAEAGAPDELEYRVKRHLCERLMAGAGLSA